MTLWHVHLIGGEPVDSVRAASAQDAADRVMGEHMAFLTSRNGADVKVWDDAETQTSYFRFKD